MARYLTSIKEVQEYMGGVSRSKINKMRRDAGLPVKSVPGGGVITTTEEIDLWYSRISKDKEDCVRTR